MKIHKLITTARTTEIDDVSDRLLVLFKKETALQNEEFLKPVFTEMEQLSAQITEAIKKDVALSTLEEADQRRDNAVRSLHNVLLGYRSMPLPTLKQHGETLYSVFEKYGIKIVKESYANESSLIEALLQDLSASELQTAISALTGVQECIAEVRKEQTAFTAVRLEYEKSMTEKGAAVTASALKKPLLELINTKLVTYLTTMKMVNAGKYSNFANLVAQTIEDTNTAIKRRGKEKKAKDKETTSTPKVDKNEDI